MKLALMQPYLFPYIGYFQLINAADVFVVHDDVQWIKGGWINRNRIMVNGHPTYITLPLQKASSTAKINQRKFGSDIANHKHKILRQIKASYSKAPYFDHAFSTIECCLASDEENLSAFLDNTLRKICKKLDIHTPFVISSEIKKKNALKGQDRVLEINRIFAAKHYINPLGGLGLYDKEVFENNGLKLSFLKTEEITYNQLTETFAPSLSIIDVMMFNSNDAIKEMLNQYELL